MPEKVVGARRHDSGARTKPGFGAGSWIHDITGWELRALNYWIPSYKRFFEAFSGWFFKWRLVSLTNVAFSCLALAQHVTYPLFFFTIRKEEII